MMNSGGSRLDYSLIPPPRRKTWIIVPLLSDHSFRLPLRGKKDADPTSLLRRGDLENDNNAPTRYPPSYETPSRLSKKSSRGGIHGIQEYTEYRNTDPI